MVEGLSFTPGSGLGFDIYTMRTDVQATEMEIESESCRCSTNTTTNAITSLCSLQQMNMQSSVEEIKQRKLQAGIFNPILWPGHELQDAQKLIYFRVIVYE